MQCIGIRLCVNHKNRLWWENVVLTDFPITKLEASSLIPWCAKQNLPVTMFLPNKSIPNSHMNDFFFKYVSITVHIGSHLRLFSLMAILDVFCHTHNIQYVICRKSGSAVRDKACKKIKLITRILVYLKETNQIQKVITRGTEFHHLKQILTNKIPINWETGIIAPNFQTYLLYYHNELN